MHGTFNFIRGSRGTHDPLDRCTIKCRWPIQRV